MLPGRSPRPELPNGRKHSSCRVVFIPPKQADEQRSRFGFSLNLHSTQFHLFGGKPDCPISRAHFTCSPIGNKMI